MEHNDLHYIKGILSNDSASLETLYRKFLPPLYGMLRRNGGSFEDAKDVFQEAIVVVFHHAARPGFQLTAPFQSYLLGIGRYIWLRQLKKNARTEVTSNGKTDLTLGLILNGKSSNQRSNCCTRKNLPKSARIASSFCNDFLTANR
ncbi:MAG: sigma-70 family RNA polymerase sigma factor [Lewinellaceae bacterium]|nr:sigma-70 family RNA polymerase sigma factor [Lewinellaceae bacterium]